MHTIKTSILLTIAALITCLLCPHLLQAQSYQWICRYPDFGYPPYGGSPWEGFHNVKYISYIPRDNILGPTGCFYGLLPVPNKVYNGNPGAVVPPWPFQSWKTSSFYTFMITNGFRGPFRKDVLQTSNYGYGSPANGGTLSAADEDGVGGDCNLWNASGFSDNSSWQYSLSIPSSTKGEVRYWGSGDNPLEFVPAPITWDMKTEVDISNLDYVTAKVINIDHTCYPAHAISVNNYVIYNWIPPRDDPAYVASCLLFGFGKITGQQAWSTHVPCN